MDKDKLEYKDALSKHKNLVMPSLILHSDIKWR